jgi:hypothetical protein
MLYTTSGVYSRTFSAANGCDSIRNLHLTIDTINVDVTQQNNTLSAVQTNAAYQWINCGSLTPIANATNASFTPEQNGHYAVQITHNTCMDTSLCYSVNNVGVLENTFNTNIVVFPNPTQGDFTIALNGTYDEATVIITSMSGQHISTQHFAHQNELPVKLQAANGAYLVTVTSGQQRAVFRLVKE